MCQNSAQSGQLSQGCGALWVMMGGGSPHVLTIVMTFRGKKSLARLGKRREGTQRGKGLDCVVVITLFCILKGT